MKKLRNAFFNSMRLCFNVLETSMNITELCITRDCIEDISKTMWAQGVITYNTLKNIRALAGAIINKRILN